MKTKVYKGEVIDRQAPESPAIFHVERWEHPDGTAEVWFSTCYKRWSCAGALCIAEMLLAMSKPQLTRKRRKDSKNHAKNQFRGRTNGRRSAKPGE